MGDGSKTCPGAKTEPVTDTNCPIADLVRLGNKIGLVCGADFGRLEGEAGWGLRGIAPLRDRGGSEGAETVRGRELLF